MIEIIKEIGIFIVIAEALLYFVPGRVYVKYVKVVIGIAMIAKIAETFLFFGGSKMEDDLMEKIPEQSFTFAQFEENEMENSSKMMILNGIEKELKAKLNENPIENFYVEQVLINENSSGEIENVSIAVSREDEQNSRVTIEKINIFGEEKKRTEEDGLEKKLKNNYGGILSIKPEQIEIIFN